MSSNKSRFQKNKNQIVANTISTESKVVNSNIDHLSILPATLLEYIMEFLEFGNLKVLRVIRVRQGKIVSRRIINHINTQYLLTKIPIFDEMKAARFNYNHINDFVMYGLICEAQINILHQILSTQYFSFLNKFVQIRHTSYGFYPTPRTMFNLAEMCKRLQLIIAIGQKNLYISYEDSHNVFDSELKQQAFKVRLLLAQKKLIKKNQDEEFHF